MAESIYKRGRHKGFTTVYRSAAQDRRLSLKARGLFLLLQSLPEDWNYTQSGLAHVAGVGRDQIRSALAELEKAGYLTAEQSHDEAGKFAGAVYVLHDESQSPAAEAEETAEESTEESAGNTDADGAEKPPLSENPTTVENPPLSGNPATGKPSTGKPSTENPTLQNNNKNNNNKHTPLTPHGGNGAEAGKSLPKHDAEHFEKFWEFYRSTAAGKQGPRMKAAKAWDKLRPDEITRKAMAVGLVRQSNGEMWRRGIGIPYAATWLNQRRWEEDTADVSSAPDGPTGGGAAEYGFNPYGEGGYPV